MLLKPPPPTLGGTLSAPSAQQSSESCKPGSTVIHRGANKLLSRCLLLSSGGDNTSEKVLRQTFLSETGRDYSVHTNTRVSLQPQTHLCILATQPHSITQALSLSLHTHTQKSTVISWWMHTLYLAAHTHKRTVSVTSHSCSIKITIRHLQWSHTLTSQAWRKGITTDVFIMLNPWGDESSVACWERRIRRRNKAAEEGEQKTRMSGAETTETTIVIQVFILRRIHRSALWVCSEARRDASDFHFPVFCFCFLQETFSFVFQEMSG